MDNLCALIKFGEKEFMERFSNGHLYFSHAKKIREYEMHINPKGQNDYLEGLTKLFTKRLAIEPHDGSQHSVISDPSEVYVRYGNANELIDHIPLLCLFMCFQKDCTGIQNKQKITLSDEVKNDIHSHFKKADTAVIITNPNDFYQDIRDSFKNTHVCEKIQYFHIDNGLVTRDGKKAVDKRYLDYLVQGSKPEDSVIDGKKVRSYTFTEDDAYRVLFCKDVYFTNEQELRILLLKQHIDFPREFNVDFKRTKAKTVSITELFNNQIFLT